ncbi:MAG TPA: hypothetical protein ENJ10_07215 [Caldithrix abyssi]|uniref:Uncharacterized protein n=1 Tax=Caldithrix abyssi TaxID=187145 RepID=A0A7V1LLY7_CALAY|nr:hypothetical protein [Caldithrix abyssi]
MEFKLSAGEAATLVRWYELSLNRSERYGGRESYVFPQEEWLVNKLKKPDASASFDELDLEMMLGWMKDALFPQPAANAVYFPGEEALALKLKALESQKESDAPVPPEKVEKARHTADDLRKKRRPKS